MERTWRGCFELKVPLSISGCSCIVLVLQAQGTYALLYRFKKGVTVNTIGLHESRSIPSVQACTSTYACCHAKRDKRTSRLLSAILLNHMITGSV